MVSLLKLKWIALLFFLLLLPLTFAVEASVNKGHFFPGEEMVFSVQTDQDALVSMFILYEEHIVDRAIIQIDETGFELFKKTVSVLDVPGDYVAIFRDVKAGENAKVDFSIRPIKPAALSLELIEPKEAVLKNKAFNLSVKLSRDGMPVENALVFTWHADGQRIQLEGGGEGVYHTAYTIQTPNDFEFPLKVFAAESDEAESDWGSEKFILDIKRIDIRIELIEPQPAIYAYNEPLEAVFQVDYPEGDRPPLVKMQQGNRTFGLNKRADGYYQVRLTELQTMAGENNPITFYILAYDRYGNRNLQEFSFSQQGYPLWYWKTNIFYVLFPSLFITYIAFLAARQFIKFRKKRKGRQKHRH